MSLNNYHTHKHYPLKKCLIYFVTRLSEIISNQHQQKILVSVTFGKREETVMSLPAHPLRTINRALQCGGCSSALTGLSAELNLASCVRVERQSDATLCNARLGR